MRQYLDFMRHVRDHGHAQERPHGNRHAVRVRLSDARRPGRGVSAADDEEGPHQVDHPRAALVSRRRHQCALPARQRRDDLGRMGRCQRRSGPDLRLSMAIVAGARRQTHRPVVRHRRADPQESGFAAADRFGLERRRHSAHEAAARATRSSSSTSPTASCRASCISAAPTFFSACRSTSRRMRC